MRIPTHFSPPMRKPGEGLLSYSTRCDEAKKRFEQLHKQVTGMTPDERDLSKVPEFEYENGKNPLDTDNY